MIGIQIALRTSNCTAAPCQFYSDPVMLEFLLGIAAFWIFSLVSWDRYKGLGNMAVTFRTFRSWVDYRCYDAGGGERR